MSVKLNLHWLAAAVAAEKSKIICCICVTFYAVVMMLVDDALPFEEPQPLKHFTVHFYDYFWVS